MSRARFPKGSRRGGQFRRTMPRIPKGFSVVRVGLASAETSGTDLGANDRELPPTAGMSPREINRMWEMLKVNEALREQEADEGRLAEERREEVDRGLRAIRTANAEARAALIQKLLEEYEHLDEDERPTVIPSLSGRVLGEVGHEGRELAKHADPEVAAIVAFMRRRQFLHEDHEWRRLVGILPRGIDKPRVQSFLPSYFAKP